MVAGIGGGGRLARRTAGRADHWSDLQSAAQPSPPTLLPSSQTSPPSRMPSPQAGTVQSVRHIEGVSKAVSVTGVARSKLTVVPSFLTQVKLEIPWRNCGVTVTDQVPGN